MQKWVKEDAVGKPGNETLVTVTFADQAGQAMMIFHQTRFEAMESRAGHRAGWSCSFERLDAYLAKAAK